MREGRTKQLERENAQLRRQVKRLEKQVRSGEGKHDRRQDPVPAVKVPKCPLCGSGEIGSYKAPSGRVRYGCKACKKWKA